MPWQHGLFSTRQAISHSLPIFVLFPRKPAARHFKQEHSAGVYIRPTVNNLLRKVLGSRVDLCRSERPSITKNTHRGRHSQVCKPHKVGLASKEHVSCLDIAVENLLHIVQLADTTQYS